MGNRDCSTVQKRLPRDSRESQHTFTAGRWTEGGASGALSKGRRWPTPVSWRPHRGPSFLHDLAVGSGVILGAAGRRSKDRIPDVPFVRQGEGGVEGERLAGNCPQET